MKKTFLHETQKALTLVELLIAISLLSFVGLLTVNIYVNINRLQGRVALENALYEDSRIMMEKISRLIRANAIDYEEYFNQSISATPAMIGNKYGCYAARFYDPGLMFANINNYPDDAILGTFGAQCITDGGELKDYIGQPSCFLLDATVDKHTGEHPYKNRANTDLKDANAFCPIKGLTGSSTPPANEFASGNCLGTEPSYTRKNLFLINPQGNVKTIIGRKKVNATPDEFAIAQLEIQGEEEVQDGITEKWSNCSNSNTFCCTEEYDCNFGSTTLDSILQNLTPSTPSDYLYKGFLPISPLRSNIEHLSFTISPSENPGLAFIEEGAKIQPTVTVTLTLSPSADQRSRFGNDVEIPRITLQTTIVPRTYDLIPSFTGPDLNSKCSTLL